MADDEVNTTTGDEADAKTTKKKLRKWRMPQSQIDLILSWSPEPVRPPRYDVKIENLRISDELKEMLRRLEV
uniref:Uncharacterized protein n=1 Tax=Leersia perrieri TaxID=77586 RepID=A0A0D9X247_9ORYZ